MKINRDETFERNIAWAKGMAAQIARKLPPSFAVEDLEQEALLAMWEATARWDPEKNNNFRGYSYMAVRGAILMACRRRHWIANTADELEDTHHAPNAAPDERLAVAEENRRLRVRDSRRRQRVINTLLQFPPANHFEAFLMRRCYLEGSDVETVAAVVGLEPRAVQKRLQSAMRLLKKLRRR